MSETAEHMLIKVDLAQDQNGIGNGAFRSDVMANAGLTNIDLISYLVKNLGPIAEALGGFLREGAGFGVICETNADGEFEVSICGLASPVAAREGGAA